MMPVRVGRKTPVRSGIRSNGLEPGHCAPRVPLCVFDQSREHGEWGYDVPVTVFQTVSNAVDLQKEFVQLPCVTGPGVVSGGGRHIPGRIYCTSAERFCR